MTTTPDTLANLAADNLPERIYLVLGEDIAPDDDPRADFDDLADVTWCIDKQFDNDVEYVRADVAALTAQALPADGRGTDAQIEKERDIARHAIVGALAAGHAGQDHPGADHWLAAAHDAGVKIRAMEAAAAALQALPAAEPIGYFKAEPMGWTDCAETDEGAVALYERPQQAATPKAALVAEFGERMDGYSEGFDDGKGVGERQAAQAAAGWVLVPVEPTDAMLAAVVTSMDEHLHGKEAEKQYREDWTAMLAARPELPQPQPDNLTSKSALKRIEVQKQPPQPQSAQAKGDA